MKRINRNQLILGMVSWAVLFLLFSCQENMRINQTVDAYPPIVPDYTGVTVPVEIAPLHFTMDQPVEKIHVVITGRQGNPIEVQSKGSITLPIKKWRQLLEQHKGEEIHVTVTVKQQGQWIAYKSFPIYISEYPIDYGLVYRLVAPGYELYSHMGIYQRTLNDFTQTTLIENTLVPGSCVNCHSFRQTDSGDMSLHMRGEQGGTILQTQGETTIIDLKTTESEGRGVYPYWHLSGNYIAYSVNDTRQVFHAVADERIEVFDHSSDLTVYDIVNNRVLTTPLLKTNDFETFPAFSPDGNWLYFCVADQRPMPQDYKMNRYNLCRIGFDPENGRFGNKIDTLVYAAAMQKSVSFPRPSYDGKYLMYTLSDYGTFSIWHKEADLWLLDLNTGETRPLTEVNSDHTESYHSWSSNSRWFVFSSRRGDGLYTRLYLASLGEDGVATKPFLLPQASVENYDPLFYSYNIPEFITAPVKLNVRDIEQKILSGERKQAQ
ncbi:hypothetical protein [Parabacteroides sp. PF5-9]|uniref:TolB family protein n=1 Tax=Parabacteroides sp. PF5-9 TaxID=1742404 RepID=UPI002474236A|nr:hypothetical protein [Parabacteroides sp. PF5-9]MDH6356595.1 Tol biopolymer transport system component [Parabacteroides sp. PF5-9]